MTGALLMNERFVAVFPSLVRALGGDLAAAAVLQAVHYRAQHQPADAEGLRWLPLPLAEIADEVGLSVDQAQRATKRLREAGLLLSRAQPGRGNYTAWAVDYGALQKDAESRPFSESTRNRGGNDAESRQKARGIASITSITEEREERKEVVVAAAAAPNAGHVVTAWIEGLRTRPPDRVIGQTAREVRALLEQGFDPAVVLEACRSVSAKGLHPSTIASEVNMLINPPTHTRRSGPATADDRIAALLPMIGGN